MACAESVQAIWVEKPVLKPGPKREAVGVLCAELGLAEKDFQMFIER